MPETLPKVLKTQFYCDYGEEGVEIFGGKYHALWHAQAQYYQQKQE